MILICIICIPIIYIILKLILCYIFCKLGKITYEGFSAAGFGYNKEKDIFYSTKNAWQKNFGYTRIYDISAPIFRMIIDTEPIHFYYKEKNWLISFWKGQYGIVTGAEIGIYQTKQQHINKNTLYLPVSEEEMLDMGFILYKNGNEITRIKKKHWWLAVFKLGMFSHPKDLTMDLHITFKEKEMLDAFLIAFQKKGYKSKDYEVIGNTFRFIYKKPKSRKVWTRSWITDKIHQFFNHQNVIIYNDFIEDVIINNKNENKKENVISIQEFIPNLIKNKENNVVYLNTIVKKSDEK